MDESAAGSLIGIIMSPLVLLIVYATVKGAATGPVERNGMAGMRIKATQRSDAAWRAGHVAALRVTRRVLPLVLLVDLACVAPLFVGPKALVPWVGILPAVALLLALFPIVRAATTAANAVP